VRRSPLLLISLLLAAFAINLDTTIVNVALPTLVRELHASNSQLQWVVDAYNLTFAALLLVAGSLSDRLGRKGMLLAGLAVFGLSSLAGGLTTTVEQLIVARCLMGVGAAMVFPSTLSLISNNFTVRADRARAIGLWGATTGMAIALGPIVGGWLLEHFSWVSVFFAMAPVAAVAAALVAWNVPTSRDPLAPDVDRRGFVLSTAAMALLVFTLIEAPNHGWHSSRSLIGFALAAALFGVFVAWERRTRAPMLDIRLFRNPRFSAASGSVTVAFFTLFGFIFLATQYFQYFKRYGPLSTGVHMLPVAISLGIGSVVGIRLAVRFGTKLVVAAGLLGMAVFFGWISTVWSTTHYATLAAQMVLYGISVGFTTAPATESIMGAVAMDRAGVGSAVNDATRLLGGTLGVAVIGSIYASLYSSRLASGTPARVSALLEQIAHKPVGVALALSEHLDAGGRPILAGAVHSAASNAFHDGLVVSCAVAGSVAIVGAIAAAALLPAQPTRLPAQPTRLGEPSPSSGASGQLAGQPLATPALTD
jgi:EmrB/QacA subfamily drug resistance transporter